jgi:hypothetical protein
MTCLMYTLSAVCFRTRPARLTTLACLSEPPTSRCTARPSTICRWGSTHMPVPLSTCSPSPPNYSTGGSTEVAISNSAGTSYNGVTIDGGGSLNVTGAKLFIHKPGQTYGGTSGGVLISEGSSMITSNGDLVITGSNGKGVMARNNSHATLSGATITGGSHGGLVATNLSSIDVSTGTILTRVGGTAWIYFAIQARRLRPA